MPKKAHFLFLILLLAGCGSLPANPKTIALGAPGQVDYCLTALGSNLFCINATRKMATVEAPDAE
jgi:hypothetical protein